MQQARRFAAKTTTSATDTMHKGAGSAEEMAQAISQGYFAATEAVRDFNVKLIEIAQANTTAALNFAQEVATAKVLPKLRRSGLPTLVKTSRRSPTKQSS